MRGISKSVTVSTTVVNAAAKCVTSSLSSRISSSGSKSNNQKKRNKKNKSSSPSSWRKKLVSSSSSPNKEKVGSLSSSSSSSSSSKKNTTDELISEVMHLVHGHKCNGASNDDIATVDDETTATERSLSSSSTLDDDSSEDEKDVVKIYGYDEAAPDSIDVAVATKSHRRSSSRRRSVGGSRGRRRSLSARRGPVGGARRGGRRSSIASSSSPSSSKENRHPRATDTQTQLPTTVTTKQPSSMPSILKSTSPSQRKSKPCPRSVEFNKQVCVEPIPDTRSCGDQYVSDKELWFQQDEYERMQHKAESIVRAVQRNDIAEGRKVCTRGLEKYFDLEKFQGMLRDARKSVMDEQEMKWDLGLYDYSDHMSEKYLQCSQRSSVEAVERARQDAITVKRFTRKPGRRHSC